MHSSSQLTSPSGKQVKSLLLAMSLMMAMSITMFARPVDAAEAANRQQAIEMAVQQNGGNGKVLGVQTLSDASGHTVYAVKILSNGRVRVFRIRQAN